MGQASGRACRDGGPPACSSSPALCAGALFTLTIGATVAQPRARSMSTAQVRRAAETAARLRKLELNVALWVQECEADIETRSSALRAEHAALIHKLRRDGPSTAGLASASRAPAPDGAEFDQRTGFPNIERVMRLRRGDHVRQARPSPQEPHPTVGAPRATNVSEGDAAAPSAPSALHVLLAARREASRAVLAHAVRSWRTRRSERVDACRWTLDCWRAAMRRAADGQALTSQAAWASAAIPCTIALRQWRRCKAQYDARVLRLCAWAGVDPPLRPHAWARAHGPLLRRFDRAAHFARDGKDEMARAWRAHRMCAVVMARLRMHAAMPGAPRWARARLGAHAPTSEPGRAAVPSGTEQHAASDGHSEGTRQSPPQQALPPALRALAENTGVLVARLSRSGPEAERAYASTTPPTSPPQTSTPTHASKIDTLAVSPAHITSPARDSLSSEWHESSSSLRSGSAAGAAPDTDSSQQALGSELLLAALRLSLDA